MQHAFGRLSRRRAVSSDGGFSMVEVLVAMVLLLLVAASGASLVVQGIRNTKNSNYRAQAATVANELIEQYRDAATYKCAWETPEPAGCGSPFAIKVATGTVSLPPDVQTSTQFTATQTTEYQDKASTASCSSTGQGGSAALQPVLAITESVTWPNMEVKPVVSHTELTPPVGVFSTSTGDILATVSNEAGGPVAGATVTVTDSTNAVSTYTTDSNGCVFAAHLPAGAAKVVLSKTGYIDRQESLTTTFPLTVVSQKVVSQKFIYDVQDQLTPAFAPASSWPNSVPFLTPVSSLPVTVANSGIAGTGTYQLPNAAGLASPVYPYSSYYSIYAGRCPDANPAASVNSDPITQVATSPGSLTAATVPLYPMTVNVTDALHKPVDLKMAETANSGSLTCTSLQTYDLGGPTVTLTPATYVVGVPLGTFQLQGTDGTRSSTVQTITIKATGNNSISVSM